MILYGESGEASLRRCHFSRIFCVVNSLPLQLPEKREKFWAEGAIGAKAPRWDASLERSNTVWFHVYDVLEKPKL